MKSIIIQTKEKLNNYEQELYKYFGSMNVLMPVKLDDLTYEVKFFDNDYPSEIVTKHKEISFVKENVDRLTVAMEHNNDLCSLLVILGFCILFSICVFLCK